MSALQTQILNMSLSSVFMEGFQNQLHSVFRPIAIDKPTSILSMLTNAFKKGFNKKLMLFVKILKSENQNINFITNYS